MGSTVAKMVEECVGMSRQHSLIARKKVCKLQNVHNVVSIEKCSCNRFYSTSNLGHYHFGITGECFTDKTTIWDCLIKNEVWNF